MFIVLFGGTIVPTGFCLCVTLFLPPAPGGVFFAKPMRENKYLTMMDPFQQKYGNVLSTLLIFPALVADVLWVTRTLVSLGKLLNYVKKKKHSGTTKCAHAYLHMYAILQEATDLGTQCAQMSGTTADWWRLGLFVFFFGTTNYCKNLKKMQ